MGEREAAAAGKREPLAAGEEGGEAARPEEEGALSGRRGRGLKREGVRQAAGFLALVVRESGAGGASTSGRRTMTQSSGTLARALRASCRDPAGGEYM